MAKIIQVTDLNEICTTHSFASDLLSLRLVTFLTVFNLVMSLL